MTVQEIYDKLCERIPEYLREPWDNDGLMCSSDSTIEVKRALITLDVTENIVDYAIANGIDLIVSHHPLIFKPLPALTENSHIARKVIKLIKNDIAVFSFHTRLDAVQGGVNDLLANALGLENVAPFGQDGEEIGRIGELAGPMSVKAFAANVRNALGTEQVLVADAGREVKRVAVLGGSGSDDVRAAIAAGADTYLTGELKHNYLADAPELGINLFAAGHFDTEVPVCGRIKELLLEADATLTVDIVSSNTVTVV